MTGYPRLFNGTGCSVTTFFSGEEMRRMNATADRLNAAIRKQARAAGFTFVDPTTAFTDHAIGDSPEWIHNASATIDESFRPKAVSQDAYADLDAPYAPQQRSTAARVRTGGQTSSATRRSTPQTPDPKIARSRPEAIGGAIGSLGEGW